MCSLKAHFDGRWIVLDEPATLAVGQEVRVIVESAFSHNMRAASLKSPAGLGDAVSGTTFTLMNGDDWDDSAALHIDPLDAVPAEFVRRPGSAAGQIKMTDDFNDTPDDFEEYL